MEIELDTFSGRPNPRWQLPPDEAGELLKKIASLTATTAAPRIPGLGYRGFLLRESHRLIRVYRGIVQIQENETVGTYVDTADIEINLATDASRRGFDSVVKEILDNRRHSTE